MQERKTFFGAEAEVRHVKRWTLVYLFFSLIQLQQQLELFDVDGKELQGKMLKVGTVVTASFAPYIFYTGRANETLFEDCTAQFISIKTTQNVRKIPLNCLQTFFNLLPLANKLLCAISS